MPVLTTLTKATIRTLVQEWMDDASGKRWTPGNLDLLVEITQDSLFSKLHEQFPYLTSQKDVITAQLGDPGFIDLRVTAQGGNLTLRLHRLQSVTRNNQEYSEIDRRNITLQDNVLQAVNTRSDFNFLFLGTELHLLPYNRDDDVEVRYSIKPTRFTTLADGAAIQWPDGHEGALIFECRTARDDEGRDGEYGGDCAASTRRMAGYGYGN